MAFVREKRIKGKIYAYLVESSWTPQGPRQKVVKYLGPVVSVDLDDGRSFADIIGKVPEEAFAESNFKDVVNASIRFALLRFGFLEDNENFKQKTITVDRVNWQAYVDKKPVVMRLGNGHLCPETTSFLLCYEGKGDPAGRKLAKYLIACAIPPDEDVFIELFTKSHKHDSEPTTISY